MNSKETRELYVAKKSALVQHGYAGKIDKKSMMALSYMISLIKPDDKPGTTYVFDCKQFQKLLRWSNDVAYERSKQIVKSISDQSWWIKVGEEEHLVRWLKDNAKAIENTRGGRIEITFHDEIAPYIFELKKKLDETHENYFFYKLKYLTMMECRYAGELYELLKSYENRKSWVFENGTGTDRDLQIKLCGSHTEHINGKDKKVLDIPSTWSNFAIFKRNVLEPAVQEINAYTDITVSFEGRKTDLFGNKTKKTSTIVFYIASKTDTEKKRVDEVIDASYSTIDREEFHQISLFEQIFDEERKNAAEEDRIEKERNESIEKEMILENKAEQTSYPMITYELLSRNVEMSEAQIRQLYKKATMGRVNPTDTIKRDLFATDLIVYYLDEILATPEETKSNIYLRLSDMLLNDYHNVVQLFKSEHHIID